MILLRLAIKSIKNRMASTILTLISISLSVILLLSVERTKRAAEEGFTNAISKVDLLVGGRTGPINLVLYTIFNIGSPTNNVSWKSYQEIKSKPEVEWTIPYSLGDSHRGFRVVATDDNFYQHYQFRSTNKIEFQEGVPALDKWDVVIGSEVLAKLKYKLGDQVIVTHGVTRGEGVLKHDDKPFHIVGILKPTGTAVDKTVYISLLGMEAMHSDKGDKLEIEAITSFFVRTKSRFDILTLQRAINTFEKEPLLAIIPGSTLAELWRGLSQIEVVLKIISVMVLAIGLASMISSLLAGLNERRREMAILRSLGAGSSRVTFLLVLESSILTLAGILIGLAVQISSFFALAAWIETEFGFYLIGPSIAKSEIIYLVVFFVCGIFVGFFPALKASNNALKDGLTIKT